MSAPGGRLQRDEIVRWTAGLGASTAEALAALEPTTTASMRARLAVAVRAGQLHRHRPLTGAPALYTATRRGLRAHGLSGLEPARVSPACAGHMIACAWAAALLQRRYPSHLLVGERALREHERRTASPLASVVLARAGGSRRLHRPDMVLLAPAPTGERPVAVEVELTVKAPRRLAEICRAWARSHHVGGVIYLAPADVERALRRAIRVARAEDKVTVLPLDALGSRRGGPAGESFVSGEP